jgi:hypothetical protein
MAFSRHRVPSAPGSGQPRRPIVWLCSFLLTQTLGIALAAPPPKALTKEPTPAVAPDFMEALKKALSRSQALLEHAHSADLAAELAHRPRPLDVPKKPISDLTLRDTANDWWDDNHVSLTGSVSNHDGSRPHLMSRKTCVQESNAYCEGNDLETTRDPSLLLNGFADLRVVYGANIGLNVRF